MLEARTLSKRYENNTALDRLELTVPAGQVFCMLGPNGAGKTTCIHLFLGFITPSEGQALVCGIDVAQAPLQARQKLAYIPETVMLYGNLSGLENLDYFATLATGRRRPESDLRQLLAEAGLQFDAMARPVAGYSKGMRQKVGIAIALAKGAEVLLLDEPTSGLDPLAANEFMQLLVRLRAGGMAVLMVTHDLFLAQQCADRIGIMQRGRLVRTLAASEITLTALEAAYLAASRAVEAAP
ncbi:MAG: ABC transporter ATP-binding protein [Rhizobacter sp.]